jgi:hypothetical protein
MKASHASRLDERRPEWNDTVSVEGGYVKEKEETN